MEITDLIDSVEGPLLFVAPKYRTKYGWAEIRARERLKIELERLPKNKTEVQIREIIKYGGFWQLDTLEE